MFVSSVMSVWADRTLDTRARVVSSPDPDRTRQPEILKLDLEQERTTKFLGSESGAGHS